MSKRLLREYALRARLYRLLAFVFAGCGLIVFVFLYINNVEGNLLGALRRPATLTMIVVPFLPAAVLSWLASRAEKKMAALLEGKAAKAAPRKKQA